MITLDDVRNLANLMRLKLTDEEAHSFLEELNSISKLINQIQKIDTTDVEPLTSVIDMHCPVRPDKASYKDMREAILANAPGKDAELARSLGYFIVPKVVE